MKIGILVAVFLLFFLFGCDYIGGQPKSQGARSYESLMQSSNEMIQIRDLESAKILLDSAISVSNSPSQKKRASLNLLSTYSMLGDMSGRMKLVEDAFSPGKLRHSDSIFYYMYTFEVLTSEEAYEQALYYIDWLAENDGKGDEELLDFNWIHVHYASTYFLMGDTIRGCLHLEKYMPEIFEGSECIKSENRK